MAVSSVAKFDFNIRNNGSLFRQFCYKVNGVAVDLTGSRLLMQIREAGPGSTVLATLDSNASGITITDAVGGVFEVALDNAGVVALLAAANQAAGDYDYDLILIPAGGLNKPLFEGRVNISQGISQT